MLKRTAEVRLRCVGHPEPAVQACPPESGRTPRQRVRSAGCHRILSPHSDRCPAYGQWSGLYLPRGTGLGSFTRSPARGQSAALLTAGVGFGSFGFSDTVSPLQLAPLARIRALCRTSHVNARGPCGKGHSGPSGTASLSRTHPLRVPGCDLPAAAGNGAACSCRLRPGNCHGAPARPPGLGVTKPAASPAQAAMAHNGFRAGRMPAARSASTD